MALQPAAGARDLNPREVERNRLIRTTLAEEYRLWGYQEVDPPSFERIDTLAAGGGIDGRELVLLASEDRLGLRPELTASIARAASTRMAERPRPLRLWADGVTFRASTGDSGHQRIQEQLQSGVELLGDASAAADVELMCLLLAAGGRLGLGADQHAQLLVGHHGLLTALLEQVPADQRHAARSALTGFNPLALESLPLSESLSERLQSMLRLRGEPNKVLEGLAQWLGPLPLLDELASVLDTVAPVAAGRGVQLRLDPSFQPHFALYDGLVLKLVCHDRTGPVEVASGGRYNALVGRFCGAGTEAAGVGFGFDVGALRDLLPEQPAERSTGAPVLVAYASGQSLAAALQALAALHGQGTAAELHGQPLETMEEAQRLASLRGCSRVQWVAA